MQDEARQKEELTTQRRARMLGLHYENTSTVNYELYSGLLSNEQIASLKIVPLRADEHNIQFGITNTTSQQTLNEMSHKFADQRVTFSLISDSGFRDMQLKYNPPKQVKYQDISLTSADQASQLSAVSETLKQVRADDMLAYIVKQAYRLKASDIHLENQDSQVRIRVRVDGVLHPIAYIEKDRYRMLISSIAVAANVSTNSNDPQTGHINKSYVLADGEQVTVNLRIETVPASYGMDVVLRLFNLKEEYLRIDNLGLNEHEESEIRDIISHPSGLVLIVGPTGSGKTTTLYSLINELNTDERKIITLEDPVEYYIKGVTQIPVDSRKEEGGFGEKFRAVLRLDPDVVMVGEIRDNDTAKTALQSALTGHLVLSSYHASTACAAITRLLDSIGENPLFVSAIRMILAQRLVRRLDDSTKQPYKPEDAVIKWIGQIVDTLPQQYQKPDLSNIQLYRAGTSNENPFGYKGQFALREILLMTPALQQELRRPANEVTTEDLQIVAQSDGMLTLMQDGILRALSGETSLEEILRVVS